MPGGRCAAANHPFGGYSRAAMVEVNVRGVKKTLYFGGVAEAHFPEHADDELLNLNPSDELGLVWSDAAFVTQDYVLGTVRAQLLRGAGAPITSGRVRSLSVPLTNSIDTELNDFFPAINRNELHFEFLIPRLRLAYRTLGSIVNSATIKQIPPYGVIYRLEAPTKLIGEHEGWRFFSALAGSAEIQTCNVKLHISGGIECEVLGHKDEHGIVEFTMRAMNVTEAVTLFVSWMIWPRPDPSFVHPAGCLSLRRNESTIFKVRAERDMFFEPKWIVLSGAKPFEIDASAAAQVPSLG